MNKYEKAIKWALSSGAPGVEEMAAIIQDSKPEEVRHHKKLAGKPKFTVVLSDIHFPDHEPKLWDIAMRFIDDNKPDSVWLMGDVLDLQCVSRLEKAPGPRYTLKQELAIGNKALDELSDAIGDRPLVSLDYYDGNHEDRIVRYLASGRCPPELVDMVQTIPDALSLGKRGFRYIGPDEQPHMVGSLAVFHGEWYTKNHAAKHLEELGGNVIYGHTHRPQIYTKQSLKGPIIGTGLPCMKRLRAEWRHQRRREFNGWMSGFTVLEWVEDFAHPRFVLYVDGKCVWNRRVYVG